MKNHTPIEIIDKRGKMDPDESTAIPNDLVDKYMRLFHGEEQLSAVMDLIRQSYKAGLDIGRNESPLFVVIPMSILENKELSANSKLLYGEIIALAKKSKKCYATNEYLARMLGLSFRSIPQLLKELKRFGFISIDITRDKKGTHRNITVSFFDDAPHRCLPRRASVDNDVKREIDIKEIDKVDNIATQSVADKINPIIEKFKTVNPSYTRLYANKTQRATVERLLKLHGQVKVDWLLDILPRTMGKKYAPVITTPLQLEEKLAQLIIFLKKRETSSIAKIS